MLTFKSVPYGANTGSENRWLPAKPTFPYRVFATAERGVVQLARVAYTDSDPEEIALLNRIFGAHDSSHAGWETGPKELAIAEAFEYELGSNQSYVKVPRRLAKHVADYASALANATVPPSPKVA